MPTVGVTVLSQQDRARARQEVEDLIVDVILPALSLLPLNSVAASDVWSFLKLFEYKTRYVTYRPFLFSISFLRLK